ncbi:MAG: hypothetical protein RI947_812 [Candidatus Parcubacteria bacterium]|jgi:hypothetical protein
MRLLKKLPKVYLVIFLFGFIFSLVHSAGAQSCSLRPHGDADCNAIIDIVDFEVFRKEYTGIVQTKTADFDGSGAVDISDFEIWRRGYFEVPTATGTPEVSNTPPVVTTSPTQTPTAVPPTATPAPVSPTHAVGCTYPAQILNLTNWKITLPIGSGSPTEIKQPQLNTYMIDPWFKVNSTCDGIQFRAHTSAPVTTANSSYPRSELREMINNGLANAAWSNSSGTHTMFIEEAITAVPKGKKHVVAGQIHDGSSDVIVIRLEFPKLFVDIGGTEGSILDPAYILGKKFTVKFVASGGKISIYYNGSSTAAHTITKTISNSYFKAGAYTQSNCSREQAAGTLCAADNYGEVIIYNLSVTHQ